MGSLNGDLMVIRNGRSTSQVSVYNYPEHLNPFYDDDQHKRLRFWKIAKNDTEGRRNSFSFGSLRDMWSFKSFRSKKKSSTLGITKTSESPPTLRREIVVDNSWNTFDNRLRHSAASSIDGDNFQRNAPYRNSLQTLPTNTNRIGFNRNDDYRSTIQVPRANPRYHRTPQKSQMPQGLRYVYGGSVTPQPMRNSNIGSSPYDSHDKNKSAMWGSSLSSMGSTNPFDTDDEEQAADTNALRKSDAGSTSTLSKSAQRKKRRAPAPPTPINGRIPAINIESSQNTAQNDELCIREDTDISNLTAEIQSFVKHKSNEDTEVSVKVENVSRVPPQEPKSKNLQGDIASTAAATKNITTTTIEKSQCSPTFNANTTIVKPVQITSVITTTTTQPKCSPTINANTEVVKPVEIITVKVETAPPHKTIEQVEDAPKVDSPIPAKREIHKTVKAATHNSVSSTVQQKKVRIEEPNVAASNLSRDSQTNGLVKTEVNINSPPSKIVSEQQATKSQTIITSASEKSAQPEVIKIVKSNGAIPKKSSIPTLQARPTPTIDPLLHIEESNNQPQRPIPVRRTSKSDREQGQIECIHVHVGSPKTSPRQDHGSSLSSFKQDHHNDIAEIITTKTPFILASPPTSRKPVQEIEQRKEIAKPSVVSISEDLSYRTDNESAKPEIKPKPALSPKPNLERNGKTHNFADIRKPMRSKVSQNTNGNVKRDFHEELAPPPPTVPMQQTNKKLNDQEKELKVKEQVLALQIKSNGKDQPKDEVHMEGLMIIETPPRQSEMRVSETFTSSSMPTSVTANATSNAGGSLSTGSCENEDLEPLYRPKPQPHMEWKLSTLAPLESNIPPEKRKSVKDIIESINRSQRLLHAAANKDFTIITGGPAETSIATMSDIDHQRSLDESQREIKRIVKQIDETSSSLAEPPSYSECMAGQKMDNSEVFQKCKINKEVHDYREASPISSNLDWNPVPKPKRTKSPYE